MKLVKQDIKNIDTYLKDKGIKHIDVRYELMDHLISEYEAMENQPDLERFLSTKIKWCKAVSKKKEKTIQSKFQDDLWLRLLKFLKSVWFYIAVLCYFSLINYGLSVYGDIGTYKYLSFLFIGTTAVMMAYYFYRYYNLGLGRKLLSGSFLLQAITGPQLFLSLLVLLQEFFIENSFLFFIYIGLAIMFSLAAITEINSKSKQIAQEYKFLKMYLK